MTSQHVGLSTFVLAMMTACGAPPVVATLPDGGMGTCASNNFFNNEMLSTRESPLMNPGRACISCHATERGPSLAFAGTVFPGTNERDFCVDAPPSPTTVDIIDKNGKVALTMTALSNGNFYRTGISSVAMPYTARVTTVGLTTSMGTPQTITDCNSCHSFAGEQGAPGRILYPQ